MKNLSYFALATATIFSITSCNNNDDNAPVNEEEVITTITTTLTNGNQTIVLTSRDLDGDGPNAPVTSVSGPLSAGTIYNGTVKFENELETPVENLTLEIEEEGDEHQIFFQGGSIGTFGYSDTDFNGKPVGINFTLTTVAIAATGNLVVTLRHEPNKNAEGVASGIITNAGGSTDAEVTYPVVLQ